MLRNKANELHWSYTYEVAEIGFDLLTDQMELKAPAWNVLALVVQDQVWITRHY